MAKQICFITTVSVTMDAFVIPAMQHLKQHGIGISLLCDMPEAFIQQNSSWARCFPLPMKRGITLFGALKSIWKMYRIFRREHFDMICYSTPNAALYASIAGRLAGIKPRVYNQWGIRYVGFQGRSRTVFRGLEWLTCRLSTHIRGVSPKNRQLAIDDHLCPAGKITVLGIGGTIGVDLKEFDCGCKSQFCAEIRNQWGLRPEEFVFGFIGRLNTDKGINELAEAFQRLWKPQSGLKLLLVGGEDKGLRPELRQWLNDCPDVIFTNQVPAIDIRRYLSAMDLLVHPTYREGFGKVIQEAMAMKVPVVTTAIPGPSEVVESEISGVLVPAKDSVALAGTLERLRNDPDLRSALAEAGFERVCRYFARPVMLSNILQDYYNLLKMNGNQI